MARPGQGDLFVRACPKCAKQWIGEQGSAARKAVAEWRMDTYPAGVETRVVHARARAPDVSEYDRSTIDVSTRVHAGCGGAMYDEGEVVETRRVHAFRPPLLSPLEYPR